MLDQRMIAGGEDATGLVLNQRPNVLIICIWRLGSVLGFAHDRTCGEHGEQRINFSLTQPVQRPYLLPDQEFAVLGEQ